MLLAQANYTNIESHCVIHETLTLTLGHVLGCVNLLLAGAAAGP